MTGCYHALPKFLPHLLCLQRDLQELTFSTRATVPLKEQANNKKQKQPGDAVESPIPIHPERKPLREVTFDAVIPLPHQSLKQISFGGWYEFQSSVLDCMLLYSKNLEHVGMPSFSIFFWC
jgi:hypothetical protein